GIMRFFFEKARESDPGADPNDFRHVGHKPRTSVTAIVMLADSLEASCRAVFQHEEPTPDAIEKVVNRVVDEKMHAGRLSESPLTLAQLSQLRKAFLSSLVGHYQQRIAYPNLPGSRHTPRWTTLLVEDPGPAEEPAPCHRHRSRDRGRERIR